MGEAIESEISCDEQTHKKGRHRKKQLYNSILQQMEFYFSDSNLSKDRFLKQLIEQNPYVELSVFLKFNKIRKLTTNIEDIRKAIKKSQLIELSEDNNSICRKIPVKTKDNVDECTIYVERLKSDATHEWVSSVFSEFGNVVYVSIPKYKHTNTVKGFAFVEFDTEQEAQNALNYFESIGCKMPSNVEPDELCSITTFEGKEETTLDDAITHNISNKRKFDEVETDNDCEGKEKKPKLEPEEVSESDDTENKKKKKLKKEHKKKNYIKELGLQVLSKKEWKKMRNRYLELQRKKMKELKRHLHKAKYSQANYEDKFKKPELSKTEESQPKLEFTEGVIVKLTLAEPCSDVKKLKNELKASCSDAKYVDISSPGSEEVYLRFSNNNSAKKFCNQDYAGKKVILEGDEEKAYWDKILKNREIKLKRNNKKQRGRDKLLKKANRVMAKHIKFDE